MTKPTYISLDCETGGIGPEVSLLTVYLAVLDQNFEIMDELDLAIKPDNDIYNVTAEALSINKINLIEHQKVAISPGIAGGRLREFLIENSDNGKIKLTPLGHNVAFDLEKVYQNLLNKKEAQKYVSYRVLDTGSTGRALIVAGIIPDTVTGSLGSYVKHYGIKEGEYHTARADTLMTVEVMKAMISDIRG